MEVRLSPEVQTELERRARESEQSTNDLIEEALAAYFAEFEQLGDVLDSRYDELESGAVKPIDGEEAFRRLMERTEARRRRPA